MSDYDYPPDEFDQPPAPGQSVGIHRAPQSKWSKVWPYLVVIIIFAALAYGLVTWFASQSPKSDTGSGPRPTATQPTDPTESSAEESTDASPTAPEEETSAEPEETETTTEAEPEPTEEETTADLDLGVAIRVLNATNRGGLAASGVNRISNAGWANATAANYTGNPVTTSAVWFKSEENRAEAEKVGQDLGIADVSLQPSLVGPISVILADDFAG